MKLTVDVADLGAARFKSMSFSRIREREWRYQETGRHLDDTEAAPDVGQTRTTLRATDLSA